MKTKIFLLLLVLLPSYAFSSVSTDELEYPFIKLDQSFIDKNKGNFSALYKKWVSPNEGKYTHEIYDAEKKTIKSIVDDFYSFCIASEGEPKQNETENWVNTTHKCFKEEKIIGSVFYRQPSNHSEVVYIKVWYPGLQKNKIETNQANTENKKTATTDWFKLALRHYSTGYNSKAREILKPHAENGNPTAELFMSILYKNKKSIFFNQEKSFDYLVRSAWHGNIVAYCDLSGEIMSGKVSKIDPEIAYSLAYYGSKYAKPDSSCHHNLNLFKKYYPVDIDKFKESALFYAKNRKQLFTRICRKCINE